MAQVTLENIKKVFDGDVVAVKDANLDILDKEFMDVAMRINPEDKMIKDGRIEKWVIRKAFEDYLPESVAWRQKEQFSDGVGYSWIDSLKEVTDKKITDQQMENAKYRFPINTPTTKEAYYYRSILFLPRKLRKKTIQLKR